MKTTFCVDNKNNNVFSFIYSARIYIYIRINANTMAYVSISNVREKYTVFIRNNVCLLLNHAKTARQISIKRSRYENLWLFENASKEFCQIYTKFGFLWACNDVCYILNREYNMERRQTVTIDKIRNFLHFQRH